MSESLTLDEPLHKLQLVLVPLDKMRANPLQPDRRSTERAVQKLAQYVVKSKVLAPPVLLKRKNSYTILDGHRRIQAAKLLGLEEIECIVIPPERSEIMFIYLNGGVAAVTGVNWLTMWAKAKPEFRSELLKEFPTKQRRFVEDFINIFGLERTMEIGLTQKQAPGASRVINMVISACLTAEMDFNKRQIGEWVLRHHCQIYLTRHAAELSDHRFIAGLLRDVEEDVPPAGFKRRVRDRSPKPKPIVEKVIKGSARLTAVR